MRNRLRVLLIRLSFVGILEKWILHFSRPLAKDPVNFA